MTGKDRRNRTKIVKITRQIISIYSTLA